MNSTTLSLNLSKNILISREQLRFGTKTLRNDVCQNKDDLDGVKLNLFLNPNYFLGIRPGSQLLKQFP